MPDKNFWNSVRKIGDDSRSAIESAWAPPYAERVEILRKRAQALALPEKRPELDSKKMNVLVFKISSEQYGIDSIYIHEVLKLTSYTPLPFTPSWIAGIIPVRGRFVSIMDLREFFRLPHQGIEELKEVIILRSNDMEFAILADRIDGFQIIKKDELQTQMHIPDIPENYILGFRSGLILLDAGKLLTDKNIKVSTEYNLPGNNISSQEGTVL